MKRIVRVNKFGMIIDGDIEIYYGKPLLRGFLFISEKILEIKFEIDPDKGIAPIRVETPNHIYVLVKE